MKYIIVAASFVVLSGCGKLSDSITTGIDGYVVKCIDGTKYVLMTSERGLAITPHLDTEGKPHNCKIN